MPRFISSLQEGILKDFYSNHLQQFYMDGILTSAIRKMLHDKRLELCISAMQLAKVLGTTSQSVHNWERGIVRHCCGSRRQVLAQFMLGELDDVCHNVIATGTRFPQLESTSLRFKKAIDRANNAMTLCRQHDKLRDQLIHDIERSTNKVLLAILNQQRDAN